MNKMLILEQLKLRDCIFHLTTDVNYLYEKLLLETSVLADVHVFYQLLDYLREVLA